MIIRKKQFSTFEETNHRRFALKALPYLKENIPLQSARFDDEAFVDFICDGVNHAKQYSIEIEWDVLRFVRFRLLLADDFDENADFHWAQEILYDNGLSPTEKMDNLDYYYYHVLDKD